MWLAQCQMRHCVAGTLPETHCLKTEHNERESTIEEKLWSRGSLFSKGHTALNRYNIILCCLVQMRVSCKLQTSFCCSLPNKLPNVLMQ